MKKHLPHWLAAGAAALLISSPSLAQGVGDVVRIVVPFSAGGPTDFMARHLAESLSRQLDKNVIVDNRPGASGNIGTKHVVDSESDGTTLVHTTAAMQSINPMMYPDAGFLPGEDLIAVGITGSLPNVLVVHPDSGIDSVEELVEKGKNSDAGLNFATFGPGSSPHFYGSLLKNSTGIDAEPIAYKGSASAITDMLAGRLDFTFDSMTTSLPHIKAGKLKGLAITASERSELLPDVPTLKETGYGDVEPTFWFALQAPKGMKPETLARLREAVYQAVQDPAYINNVTPRGVKSLVVAPSELDEFMKSETAYWKQAANSIGIKPE